MAALGKIRKRGVTLIVIIGLGLFAFIAEEMFRSCEAMSNEKRQQVGEILGNKISVQEFQVLVDEYQDFLKVAQGVESFTDQDLNNVKDFVWNKYVENTLIAEEAEKIGLTVTDVEMQNLFKEGTNPILLQLRTPFVNQQTGRFDASLLTKFLSDYNNVMKGQDAQAIEYYQTIYKYWRFVEKNLRTELLSMKYRNLLLGSLLSNPVSAKMSFEGENTEADIKLASLAYNTINDDKVEVTEKDLKAKYEELKETFKQPEESRDIKYVAFKVLPSENDRNNLVKTMTEASAQFKAGESAQDVVRKAQSLVPFVDVPVSKKAFSNDVAMRLDSISVGETSGMFESRFDNTLNVVKLISKAKLADSIQYRQIQVVASTIDEARVKADSIVKALNGGADFETLAKKYGQTGEKQWLKTADYERAQSFDKDNKAYINAINTQEVNAVKNIEMTQGNVILQVLDRRAMIDKYVAAVVKRTIDFSKQTYSEAFNKFSQYVSENQTIEGLEKNADKYGFKVVENADLYANMHEIARIRGTHEALKWVFEATPGKVSPLYECGDNDYLMVVALTNVHNVGYKSIEDVKDILKSRVLVDKKFEMLKEKLQGSSNIDAAKAKGAMLSDVNKVTFNAPAFISVTGSQEPSLSGAVDAIKEGQFCKDVVKGNGGAYMFQVVKKTKRPNINFDEKQVEQRLMQTAYQAASGYMNELYLKANVLDKRYLFF